MKLNCKPGDLCIALAGEVTPEMKNMFVAVVRAARSEEFFDSVSRNVPVWIIRPASGGTLPVRMSNGDFVYLSQRPYADDLLKPINGDQSGNESWFKAAPLTAHPELTFEQVRRALGRREPA